MMPHFRKKPVVIEAEMFINGEPWPFAGRGDPCCADAAGCYIATLEGRMRVNNGDMVIRGVAGEFYPCRPAIFTATYELAEQPEVRP